MTATGQQGASSRKNSLSELEEGLPLCAELQYTETLPDLLPHAKASPMEVSDFLAYLLTDARHMSTEGARRVAALWTEGTGQELRSYSPAMYFEIFGKEDGWIVYREVHLALYRERSRGFWYKFGALILLVGAISFTMIATIAYVSSAKGSASEGIGAGASLCVVLGLIFCLFAALNMATQAGEKMIERRLNRALEKDDRPRS